MKNTKKNYLTNYIYYMESDSEQSSASTVLSDMFEDQREQVQKCVESLGNRRFERFCNVIYNAMNDTNLESNYADTIHQMYSNSTVAKQILKSANGSICFQDNILLFINNPEPLSISLFTDTDEDVMKPVNNTMFASMLRKCIHQTLNNDYITIGIPLTYIYMNSHAHQNMLIIIIDKIKNKITVEHFDPHGYLSNRLIPICVIKFIEIAFNARVTDINIIFTNAETLFPIVLPEIMAFEYVSPLGICGNTSIQSLTARKRKWASSCVLFSLWYGFLRLLNSKEDYKVTYNRMMNMMNASPDNPYRAIQNIAKSIFDVLDITDASPGSDQGPRVRGFSNINTSKGIAKFTRRSPERMPFNDASTPSNSPQALGNRVPLEPMAKPKSVKNKSTRKNKLISKIAVNKNVLSKFRADLKAARAKGASAKRNFVSRLGASAKRNKNANSI